MIAFALLIIGPVVTIHLYLHRGGCRVIEETMVVSPDGMWIAISDESWCESPFVTAIDAGVRLVSNRNHTDGAEILGMSTGGREEERPRIEWAASDVLLVTVPNLSFLKVLRRDYKGVRIRIRFEPDNPQARAEWLRR